MPNNVLSWSHCVDCGRARGKQQPQPQVHAVVLPPAANGRHMKVSFNATPYQPPARSKNSGKGPARKNGTTIDGWATKGKGRGTPAAPTSAGAIPAAAPPPPPCPATAGSPTAATTGPGPDNPYTSPNAPPPPCRWTAVGNAHGYTQTAVLRGHQLGRLFQHRAEARPARAVWGRIES